MKDRIAVKAKYANIYVRQPKYNYVVVIFAVIFMSSLFIC